MEGKLRDSTLNQRLNSFNLCKVLEDSAGPAIINMFRAARHLPPIHFHLFHLHRHSQGDSINIYLIWPLFSISKTCQEKVDNCPFQLEGTNFFHKNLSLNLLTNQIKNQQMEFPWKVSEIIWSVYQVASYNSQHFRYPWGLQPPICPPPTVIIHE